MENNIEKAFSNGYYGRKLRKEYKKRRDWKYYLKRGEKAFEKGLLEESYEYLSKSIEERMPPYQYNSRAYFLRAIINYDWELLTDAAHDLTQAISRQPYPGFYEFYLRGIICLRLNKLRDAIKDFKKSISLNPNHFESHFNKGSCNYDIGNYFSAIRDFDNALKINKKDKDLFINRGLAYFQLANYKNAIIDFDKVKNLSPFSFDIFFYSGQSKSRLRDYIKAKEEFSYIINSINNSENSSQYDELLCSSYLEKAWANSRIGMASESIEDLKKSLNFSCKGVLFYKHLIISGYTYSKLNKYSDSIRFYDQAENYIQKEGFSGTQKAFLLMLRGIVLAKSEYYENALEDIEKMFKFDKKILEKDEEKVFDEMPEYMKNILRISLNISLS